MAYRKSTVKVMCSWGEDLSVLVCAFITKWINALSLFISKCSHNVFRHSMGADE